MVLTMLPVSALAEEPTGTTADTAVTDTTPPDDGTTTTEPTGPSAAWAFGDNGTHGQVSAGSSFSIKVTDIVPPEGRTASTAEVKIYPIIFNSSTGKFEPNFSKPLDLGESASANVTNHAATIPIDTSKIEALQEAYSSFYIEVVIRMDGDAEAFHAQYQGKEAGADLHIRHGTATQLVAWVPVTPADLVILDTGKLSWKYIGMDDTAPLRVYVADQYGNEISREADGIKITAEASEGWRFKKGSDDEAAISLHEGYGYYVDFDNLLPVSNTENAVAGAQVTFTAPNLNAAQFPAKYTFTVPGMTSLSGKTVTITGSPYYNQTLAASLPAGIPTDAVAWSWKVDNTAVDGATGPTYTIKKADIGKTITATATAKADGDYAGSATGTVTAQKQPLSEVLILSVAETNAAAGTAGTIEAGDTLTASVTGPSVATDDTFPPQYQWYKDGAAIENAKQATYLIPEGAGSYSVKVTAPNDWTAVFDGEVTSASYVVGQAVPAKPDAPTGLTATPGNGQVTLSWTAPKDNGAPIVSYNVYCAVQGAGFTISTESKTTSYTFPHLTNGTTYMFWVDAVNAAGRSDDSSTVTATPAAPSSGDSGDSGGSGHDGSDTSSPASSGSTASTPATSGGNTSVDLKPSVSNGSATATVSSSTAQALANDAVKNHSTNVTITVETDSSEAATSVTANLPASAANTLANDTSASLTVDTAVANVVIPNSSLGALGSSGGTISVTASRAEDESVTVAVKKNGRDVGELPGGLKVNVPVSRDAARAGSGLVAVLVNADGSETILPKSSLDAKGGMKILLDSGTATVKFMDNRKTFPDTNGHWASDAVDFVSSRDLFQGTESGAFRPDMPMDRAMLVTVLHRLEREPSAGTVSFADVPSDGYYAQAAAWAADAGIVTGNGTGFGGDALITREQLATMLYRYVQQMDDAPGSMGSYAGMGGADQVHSWASDAMSWAVGSGIFIGNDGNLRPGDNASRGEVATSLARFVDLITR